MSLNDKIEDLYWAAGNLERRFERLTARAALYASIGISMLVFLAVALGVLFVIVEISAHSIVGGLVLLAVFCGALCAITQEIIEDE